MNLSFSGTDNNFKTSSPKSSLSQSTHHNEIKETIPTTIQSLSTPSAKVPIGVIPEDQDTFITIKHPLHTLIPSIGTESFEERHITETTSAEAVSVKTTVQDFTTDIITETEVVTVISTTINAVDVETTQVENIEFYTTDQENTALSRTKTNAQTMEDITSTVADLEATSTPTNTFLPSTDDLRRTTEQWSSRSPTATPLLGTQERGTGTHSSPVQDFTTDIITETEVVTVISTTINAVDVETTQVENIEFYTTDQENTALSRTKTNAQTMEDITSTVADLEATSTPTNTFLPSTDDLRRTTEQWSSRSPTATPLLGTQERSTGTHSGPLTTETSQVNTDPHEPNSKCVKEILYQNIVQFSSLLSFLQHFTLRRDNWMHYAIDHIVLLH